jgi:hypothetical protein
VAVRAAACGADRGAREVAGGAKWVKCAGIAAAFSSAAMDTLHSDTLDFLVHYLKATHEKLRKVKTFADRKVCKAQIEHLRRRITLEFYYQTQGKGDSSK